MNIYKYEVKKLIKNKFYLLFLVVMVIYSHMIMTDKIVLGIQNTAPYSVLSFRSYILNVSLFVITALLCLILKYSSENEKKTSIIIDSTPFSRVKLKIIRYMAVFTSISILILFSLLYSFVFYYKCFDYTDFGILIMHALLILIPEAVAAALIAEILKKIDKRLIYVMIFIFIIMSILR